MMMKDEQLIQRREVSKILGVSGQAVDKYRLRGVLLPVQFMNRGRYRYKKSDVLNLLKGK